MSKFSSEFLKNLQNAIISLYDRDKRLGLNGENFWVVEKNILEKYDKLSYIELTSTLPPTILVNLPHTIPFSLRAKVFQHLISGQQGDFSIHH